MQSVFAIVAKLIASINYFCKEVFCNNFGRDGTLRPLYVTDMMFSRNNSKQFLHVIL